MTTTRLLTATAAGIGEAARLLRDGALVAFGTETVYGLGGDATNAAAVAAIYTAKGRPSFNPLIAHVCDLAQAQDIAELPDWALALAADHWPGPLTLVVPVRSGTVADLVTAGLPTVAVRVPAHPTARALLKAVGRPVAAPSANPSGRISPTTAAHVMDGLSDRIAAVLDTGPCETGLESTIVGADAQGHPALLRPGGLSIGAIEGSLGQRLAAAGPGITAPGQLSSHYAPDAAVRLNVTEPAEGDFMIGFGVVGGDINLSPAGDTTEAATRLFSALHQANASGRAIAVAPIPKTGLGVAINDRLARAAAPRG
ncbi:MAG: L-threonylcarbamoyladenylate synthase [Pseudomonadota bacterium]